MMRKSTWFLAFFSFPLVLTPFLASPRVEAVLPPVHALGAFRSSQAQISQGNDRVASILATADRLSAKYGSSPPYFGPQFAPGERLSPELATMVAPYVLAGESENEDVGCIVDSNGKLSCGRAQFQDWHAFWEPASGISGDPNNPPDAVRMLLWGLENGYVQKWGAAWKLGIVVMHT